MGNEPRDLITHSEAIELKNSIKHNGLFNLHHYANIVALYVLKREASKQLKPCRSPYCECIVGSCTHPGCYDARYVECTPMEIK